MENIHPSCSNPKAGQQKAVWAESSSWMQSPTKGSSSSLWSQIGCQWGNGFSIVTRIIGKFDCDRFRGAFRNCSVQLLNGTLRFYSLVKSDKTDTFGESCDIIA